MLFLFILTPEISGAVLGQTIAYNTQYILAQNNAVWEELDHDYTGTSSIFPHDIVFINGTHGWVLSQNESTSVNGTILHTEDSGDSWYLQYSNETQTFRRIVIINNNTLWVSCRSGVCYTHDGGLTWHEKYLGGPFELFYGLFFLNRTHGWTASNEDMYKTTDGGLTWAPVESWPTADDWARSIYFVSPTEGWAIGFLGVYHTDDGGDTWTREFNQGGWDLSFVSEDEAWAVADDWLAHMTDGETWVMQTMPRTSLSPVRAPYFSDIQFIDENNGWIAGDESEIVYTPNGGRDWYTQTFPRDTRVMAIDFINVTHGWAVSMGGYIYRTTRGNSLGARLWLGMTDPLILTIVGGLVSVVLVASGGLFYRHRKRRI